MWLLAPSTSAQRVTRRIQHEVGNIRANQRFRDLIGQPGPRTQEERLAEIRSILGGLGIDPEVALKRPATYEKRMKIAGDALLADDKEFAGDGGKYVSML